MRLRSRTSYADFAGPQLYPLLKGEEIEDWPESTYYRYWEHDDPHHHVPAHYGVRTRTHKLICYYGDGLGVPGTPAERMPKSEWELFDLEKDPQELTNVIGDESYAVVLAGLQHELARLQRHYGDEPYRGMDTPRPDWGENLQLHS